jgi:hypothetical protein
MKSTIIALPLYVKLSALLVGVPMVMLGCTLIVSDLNEMIRVQSISGFDFSNLVIGPLFAVVGISFLWPMRPFRTH